jgi:hypothetical protein
MTLILSLLSSAGVLKWLGIGVAALVALVGAWFHGRSTGTAAGIATAQAQDSATIAQAQTGQQVAQAQADAAQADAQAAQAHTDAVQTAQKVSTAVDQLTPEQVKNELDNNWSR